MAIVVMLLIGLLFARPAAAGYWKYTCKNGQSERSAEACKNKGGVKSQQYVAICGDGILDTGEQCDNGSNNSDVAKNACRTDCRRAYCGDGVIDTGEQCDDGSYNSNTASNACRQNCRLPVCGDGIVDDDRHLATNTTFNEACDDGNKDDSDGCMTTCRTCLQLDQTGNIDITSDTALCPAEYHMDDYGDFGAIIIKATGVTLDCQGAILVGEGRGVGVLNFRSNDVTIANCVIRGYDVGLRIQDARNVTLRGNQICDNRQRNIELIDATDINGYKPSMAATSKCVTAQIQQQSRNLAKIAVAPPSESPKGKATGRPMAGIETSRHGSATPTRISPVGKSAKPMASAKLANQKETSPAKAGAHYLISQAARANWTSQSGRVVFGSDRLPQIGQARTIPRGRLADGQQAANQLLTQPEWKRDGYIQGIFPALQLGRKARFRATVAMLKGADPTDTLSFEVIIRDGGNVSVVKSQRLRGTQKVLLDADLSRWSGKKIQLILKAHHIRGRQALPAVWINPSISNEQ